MSTQDLQDQDAAVAEAKVSRLRDLPVQTVRRLAAWAKANRIKALAIGGASFIAIVVVASWALIAARLNRSVEELVTMDQVLQVLDHRQFAESQSLVQKIQKQGSLPTEELGGPAYVLGAAAAYEAESASGKDRIKLFSLAAGYLEEANNRGFPANRGAEGLYLLGKSLYEIGRIQASRSILLSALESSSPYQAEIYFILANTYLNDTHPKIEQALEQNTKFLAEKGLSEAKQQEGLLQRASVFLRLGKISECNATLDRIPEGVKNPAVAVERGRALMYEARDLREKTPITAEDKLKSREKYNQAAQIMRIEITRNTRADKATRQAMYLSGMCYMELEDYQAALDRFTRTYNTWSETPEGLAACFQSAELYRRLGRDVDALAGYRRVLGSINDPEGYNNPWISEDQLKTSISAAYQHYLGGQKFEIALQIARMMQPLFPIDQVLSLQAEAHGVWGQTLLNQADKGPRNKAEPIRRLGREQLRRAGTNYAKLSKILPANKNYSDQVWNGATSYMQGQDFSNAARMFQVYLKNEAQRRHPQALAYLGESLLALNQPDKALDALKECMDLYPRDVYACRARLLASRAYEEKGDWSNAESLLLDNLNGDYLTPESKEWRDSLFALGKMFHDEGRSAEAVGRLEEAAERYPDLPETTEARYLTANCYYKLAAAAQDKLDKDLTGTYSAILEKQTHELYSKALTLYKRVHETLAIDRDNGELNAGQKAILRNCYFAVGNVLYAEGNYDAAVNAYSTAANRYQNYPESLNAYVQIANAYRKLNKPEEAKNALQQAKFALGLMKPDAAFDATTNYNAKQWAERLDLLSSL
jgi:tetratricopeptide (TPR) repeat protein